MPTPPEPDLHLDLPFVRASFPGLETDWVLMDNAGGSQILGTAVERLSAYLREANVQHGASYDASREAVARVRAGTEAVARLLGTSDPRRVVLGPSSTQLLFNLSHAMCGTLLRPGDAVLVSNLEHETNAGPWYRLAEDGYEVRTWKADPDTWELTPESLERAWRPNVRLVCFTHASNLLGGIVPVAELTREVHRRGAMVVVDGVAYAPHRRLRVEDWGVDFYLFSLYKTYGPHQAALYGKAELLLELRNIHHDFLADDDIPYKLQPGGVNYEAVASLDALPEYFEELGRRTGGAPPESGARPLPEDPRPDALLARGYEAIAAHEERLAAKLLAWLAEQPGVTIHGPATAERRVRVPTVSFTVEGRRPEEIVGRVDRHRVGIRHGHFYAKRLADDLGISERGGAVRVSMVHYNTLEEVDRLLEALEDAL